MFSKNDFRNCIYINKLENNWEISGINVCWEKWHNFIDDSRIGGIVQLSGDVRDELEIQEFVAAGSS